MVCYHTNTNTMNRKSLVIILVILLSGGVVFVIRQASQKGISPPEYAFGQTTPQPTGGTRPEVTDSRYVPYSPAAFDAAREYKRVLYFHADWCSVCRPLE